MCAALLCFSCLDARRSGSTAPSTRCSPSGARYAASMVLVLVFINPCDRGRACCGRRRPWLQVVRSRSAVRLDGAATSSRCSTCSSSRPLSILFATPLLVALLAGPMLGEWVGPRRLVAIARRLRRRPRSSPARASGTMHPAVLLSVAAASPTPSTRSRRASSAATIRPQTTMVYSGLAGHGADDARSCPSSGPLPASAWTAWLLFVGARGASAPRALAPDPGACARAGADAVAVHLHADRLDAGARLSASSATGRTAGPSSAPGS